MAKKSLSKVARDDYEVGYRRPPYASRWQKGASANPSGRPKGSHNIKSVIRKRLLAQVTVRENGKPRTITSLEALFAKALNEALQGRPKAFIDVCKFLQSAGLLSFEEQELQQLYPSVTRTIVQIVKPQPRPGDPNYRAPSDNSEPQINPKKYAR